MKFSIYLFPAILLYLCSCTKNVQTGKSEIYFQRLSSEIENTKNPDFYASSEKETFVNDPSEIILAEDFVVKDEKRNIPAANLKREKVHNRIQKNTSVKDPEKVVTKNSTAFDKENIFWKIAQGLSSTGLILLVLFGGIALRFESNVGLFFFGGAMIGLAVLILSIPFYLLGLITGAMKKNPKPTKDADEI